MGLFGSFNQALARLIALLTEDIALDCHITFDHKYFSKSANLFASLSISLETGIHVHFDIITAISSS
jgi:hypothetical protein